VVSGLAEKLNQVLCCGCKHVNSLCMTTCAFATDR
jgi:hypothetical protein